MRVPSIGLPLDERLIIREGKQIAERMLAGYRVTATGRFVPETQQTGVGKLLSALVAPFRAIAEFREGQARR